MVSLEPLQPQSTSLVESSSSPRISFSSEFLDESNFISICPDHHHVPDPPRETRSLRNVEFEFLSGNLTNMMSADELFSEGKLLPFCQVQHIEKLNKITLKTEDSEGGKNDNEQNSKDDSRISWFLDDDPSPRPPKCTVLWKELLRLRKQRASTLSPSSSSSGSSLAETSTSDDKKVVKRVKKGLERTRSASIRIRPVINVPICTQGKSSGIPLFSSRRGN